MKSLIIATYTGLLLCAASQTVMAQATCGPRENIVDTLGNKHGEHVVAGGIAGPQKLLEVWSADDGSTWTLLLTDANGTSCIIAAGQEWQDLTPLMGMMGVES